MCSKWGGEGGAEGGGCCLFKTLNISQLSHMISLLSSFLSPPVSPSSELQQVSNDNGLKSPDPSLTLLNQAEPEA